jgi:3',5'-cyclic AMP phosphodiesterase CpdA
LTQRAKAKQFQQAREFLDALPSPQVIVPGNHDIPLYNVFSRFLKPLKNYRRHITNDLQPFYLDEEIAVLGLNTARSLTFKEGRINHEQTAHARERLYRLQDGITKILVTHHPFEIPVGHDGELVGRSKMVMEVLASCGADVLLSGHLHISNTASTAARYKIAGHAAIVVQAGTATSTRGRGEANSFNVLRVEQSNFLTVERLSWQPEQNAFTVSVQEHFRQTAEGWAAVG